MIIFIDSNEFINFINKKSLALENLLINQNIMIYLNYLIVREILRNIRNNDKKELYAILSKYNIVIFDEKTLPLYLIEKYENLGLKKGDVIIAASCEFIKADYLVTENRHFLKNVTFDNFQVLNLNDFLNKLK